MPAPTQPMECSQLAPAHLFDDILGNRRGIAQEETGRCGYDPSND